MSLSYTYDEILSDDDYARPHVEAGYKLHGGFDAEGRYVTPRMKVRGPAVDAWRAQLLAAGGSLIDADQQLLSNENFPTYPQMKLLIQHGLEQGLWNSLTITGVIEARGQQLCEFTAPDFQKVIVEDVSEMAIGHLNKGLLHAHGMDEGGKPGSDLGAHDAMWFAVRDTLLGKDAYPLPQVPENIARPDADRRELGDLPIEHEMVITLLMNVLMIEVRAENFFNFCCDLMRDPDLFTDRRQNADWSAEIVDRIRQDEAIHVDYLQLVLSEMRNCTFRTADGGTRSGAELLDPLWNTMVHWHAVENPKLSREQARKDVEARILAAPNGDQILKAFRSLDGRRS